MLNIFFLGIVVRDSRSKNARNPSLILRYLYEIIILFNFSILLDGSQDIYYNTVL